MPPLFQQGRRTVQYCYSLFRRFAGLAVLAVTLPLAPASGEVILAGTTYLESSGGFYHFAPDLPPATFHGVPLGILGDTDSVLRRLEDAVFPAIGTTVRVPVEMLQIRAEGDAPVSIGGRLFNFAFALTPGTQSAGYIDITLDSPEDGTLGPHGSYSTHVTLNFTAFFTPTDGGFGEFASDASIFIESVVPGSWSFNPPADYCLVEGAVGDVAANLHRNRPAGSGDFFTIGPMPMATRTSPPNGGIHNPCKFSPTPEPPVVVLLVTAVMLGWFGIRRRPISTADIGK